SIRFLEYPSFSPYLPSRASPGGFVVNPQWHNCCDLAIGPGA
ncbi:2057_t:CDS:1, partial [Dentiscutata erythropus]